MSTIFKKEIKSYFRRAAAFYFIVAFLLLARVFFAAYNSLFGYYTIELVLPALSIILAVSLPFLVMNIFSRDRKNGTDKLLYSLPFKTSHIVLGKYFAMLCILGIQVAFLAILPIVFGFFGMVNYLAAYLSLICFFLFGAAMLAMCIFIAAAIKSKVLTVIISYVAMAVAFLLYLVPIGASDNLWMTVAKTLRFLSPFLHLDNFAIGAVKINSIIYFVIFGALFLFLAIRAEGKNRTVMNYGNGAVEIRHFSLSPVLATILCVCALVTNTALSFLPIRLSNIDVTHNKSITLSTPTKEFLSSLDCNVDIYVINADGSNKKFEHLVELYDEHSDKLTVKYVYQDDIRDKLIAFAWDGTSDIATNTLLIESEKGRYQVFHPNMGYYYSHPELGELSESEYEQYYQYFASYASTYAEAQEMFNSLVNETKVYSSTEQQLTALIEYTALDIIPSAYYLTGHGEPSPEKSNIYYLLNQVHDVFKGTFDLSSATALPEDTSTLIINAPASDLSSEETETIKDFLADGGSMTIITNEANLDMPNLMSLLANYGVSAKKGYVCFDYEAADTAEESESEETELNDISTEEDEQETESPDKDLVYAQANVSHPSISALQDLSYSYQVVTQVKRANHIDVSSELGTSLKVTPLLVTDNESFIDGVENSKGAKTVAVAIEETVDGRTTTIAWYTGADSFDGENGQTLNVYAAAYSVLWGIDEPTSNIGTIEPKLVTINHPSITGITKHVLQYSPWLLAAPITYCYLKYKKNPFAAKKADEENTEE